MLRYELGHFKNKRHLYSFMKNALILPADVYEHLFSFSLKSCNANMILSFSVASEFFHIHACKFSWVEVWCLGNLWQEYLLWTLIKTRKRTDWLKGSLNCSWMELHETKKTFLTVRFFSLSNRFLKEWISFSKNYFSRSWGNGLDGPYFIKE